MVNEFPPAIITIIGSINKNNIFLKWAFIKLGPKKCSK